MTKQIWCNIKGHYFFISLKKLIKMYQFWLNNQWNHSTNQMCLTRVAQRFLIIVRFNAGQNLLYWLYWLCGTELHYKKLHWHLVIIQHRTPKYTYTLHPRFCNCLHPSDISGVLIIQSDVDFVWQKLPVFCAICKITQNLPHSEVWIMVH